MLAELRRRGGWPPVILMTAWDAPGLAEQALQLGAAAYLAKPFASAALLEAIDAAIDQH